VPDYAVRGVNRLIKRAADEAAKRESLDFRNGKIFPRAHSTGARSSAGGGEGQLGQLAAAALPCRGTSLIAVARLSLERWRARAKEGNALDNNIHKYQFVTVVTAKAIFHLSFTAHFRSPWF
jgi:hypothetical protein